MSDVPQRQGWWQASDGKWYPPGSGTAPPSSGTTKQSIGTGAVIIMISAGIATLASFAPLASGTDAYGAEIRLSSWSDVTREFTIFAVLAIVVLILTMLRFFGSWAPPDRVLTFSLSQWVAVIGFAGVVICAGQTIDNLHGAKLEFGFFMQLLAAIGLFVGGIVSTNEERTTSAGPI